MVFLGALAIIAFVVLASIVRGFVLSILWGWFLVPLGLPAISIPLAIGVSMIVHMLTDHGTAKADKDLSDGIAEAFIGPLIILGIGWIVALFL